MRVALARCAATIAMAALLGANAVYLAAVTALCGIGIIALPTGMLAGAFSDAIRHAREDRQHGGPDT